jgi:Ca2+-binding RTX toxin-like protein
MGFAFTIDRVAGGVLADLVSYDNVYVAKNVTVGSTDNIAIDGHGDFHLVTVMGDLFGTGFGIDLGDSGSSTGNDVFIGAVGSVTGSAGHTEAGRIDGVAIGVFGVDTQIENRGRVFGQDTGILINSFQSDTAGSLIINKGEIEGWGRAIDHQSSQMLEIRNKGTIESEGLAISGSFGIDKVLNRGQIIGNVDLGEGDDIYDGRKAGTVDGTVTGGSGHDILTGGTGSDWLAGSYDKDTLTGGSGSDTFVFDSSLLGNADADVIVDFDPAHDKIALDHNIFSAIRPIDFERPPFHGDVLGTHVHYAADGTLTYHGASGSPAIAFAQLGADHPRLTAFDFVLI